MKGARAALVTKMRRAPGVDLPRVVVAAPTTAASSTIAQALRDAGYLVGTARTGTDVLRALRTHKAVELFVLDGSEEPWLVGTTIDAARAVDWTLPIILVTRPDPAIRAEADGFGVEAILEAPVRASEVRRAAERILPTLPEVEFGLAG